jgi:RNA polymerase sigma-70 factor (ECF subfamily)
LATQGDHARFAAIYRESYPLILLTCERRLNDRRAAEDATAEVFRIAWQRHAKGDELTLPWLYRVARNVVGNEYRRSRRARALDQKSRLMADPHTDPANDPALQVRAALARLKPRQRELLFMAYWEDLTASEMAHVLGCSIPALWVRLNRARAALRAVLTETTIREEVSISG